MGTYVTFSALDLLFLGGSFCSSDTRSVSAPLISKPSVWFIQLWLHMIRIFLTNHREDYGLALLHPNSPVSYSERFISQFVEVTSVIVV